MICMLNDVYTFTNLTKNELMLILKKEASKIDNRHNEGIPIFK